MSSLKKQLRRIVGSPFSISTTIDSKKEETLEVLGEHTTGLREDERATFEPVFKKFCQERWVLKKFVYTIKGNILLDTSLGWALSGFTALYYSNSSLVDQAREIHKPNILKWLQNRWSAPYYAELVWMPYGTNNYWHFLNDFVGALSLIQDIVTERKPVVLVHESVANSKFFKEIVGYSTFLSSLDYKTYSSDKWVRCSSFITARTYFGTRESLKDAISLLDLRPPVTTRPIERIFISRVSRRAINQSEVDEFFTEHGFRIVLFDSLMVREQIDIINSANIIAALHGAGMVNLAFHENPQEVTMIEIIPEDHINPCFAFLAEEMGMNYQCVGAGAQDKNHNTNYWVSIEKLEALFARIGIN